ncbi:Ni/Fe hydrogenase subunit alpha [Catenulispora subtropica]|uniref:Ni/Fe hydrogenase subunit alpha n=1 Tax=Catenulispora subtropica TaxID=450798 RepID=A0ABP5D1Z2_9ACTN
MSHVHERTLRVRSLARVEGEGAMRVKLVDGRVREARLDIYEPPRFFEAFLRGRAYTEAPDITARVCGICPVAYQTSACRAMEDACGVRVQGQLAELRRLLYCGEWIESHALHIHLLHAPDFLGCPDGIALARTHRAEVERGLAVKRIGNALMELLGGRAIHPVNVRLGGFHRLPTRAELRAFTPSLRQALDLALETTAWVAGFAFPEVSVDHRLVALDQGDRYPIDGGDLVRTDAGDVFEVRDFEDRVREHQVPHSTALHAELVGVGRYLTGPLARYTLHSSRLSPQAAAAAREAGLGPECRNPFRSIVVRAVETVYAIEEALRIVEDYDPDPSRRPAVDVPPRAGRGSGASEAPRGLLYHGYDLAADGVITRARIVPPTAQNQAAIETDLSTLVADHQDLDDAALTALCERAIRNHDPCISCAAHFLDLHVERT